jgi:prephenate dehydrogenase
MGEEATAPRLNLPMKVAIIGGAGRMGSWFARYFKAKGFPTILSDVRDEETHVVAQAIGAELADTNLDAVECADMALVCVPIKKTREVILEVAPNMKRGAILTEISSIKSLTMDALRRTTSMGIRPLSLHPMFGPVTGCLKGKTIVVVPVTDGGVEYSITKRMFEEAEITVADSEEHDRAMAVAISLTYFMNLALAQVLRGADLISLKGLAGTTFTVQLAIVESVVAEDPSLVESLLKENSFTELYVDRFISEAETLRELIKGETKNFNELYNFLKASLGRDPDYLRAEERRYKVFKALRASG